MGGGDDGFASDLRNAEKSVPLELVRRMSGIRHGIVVLREMAEHGGRRGFGAVPRRRGNAAGEVFHVPGHYIVTLNANPHQLRFKSRLFLPIRAQERFS